MTETEYKTHMSLWSMLAAPLLAGNDLRSICPAILSILTNREVIAVDQDKDGKQAKPVWKSGDQEIRVQPLDGGATAVAIFNRALDPAKVTCRWTELGVNNNKRTRLRDLWEQKDLEWPGPEYSAVVPGHGIILLRLTP